ncbi:DBH-like monooxygenase protein 1 homolog [Mytilus edulis]|uniref:DBH-like monooxygenase protein 1 homolog n=1 Tax=Mytilus edulis TaxID=6550 RepID=UPI0039EF276B
MKRAIYFAFLYMFGTSIGKPNAVTQHVSPSKPTPTEIFGNSWQLDSDGNYWLFWKTNTTHITFETHVKTKGYVGFGLSSNGKMFPSDVVVGWVDSNGTAHFKDCHTEGHYAPTIDVSQDWMLLQGLEDNFGTVLKFVRKLDTCDDKDYQITDNTIKVIYSYHPDDPASFDTLPWHGANRRGAKSLMLLSAVKANDYQLPPDAEQFDILHNNFHVPANTDTTYQCTIFKVPEKPSKRHMIRFEPIITRGNEDIVHHFVVYSCPTATDNDEGSVFNCYGVKPKKFEKCNDVMLAWAVGGVGYDFPHNVGFSLNAPGDPRYLLLETHFTNPTLKSGIVDSSGFRITVTPTLRQYDAGMLEIGAMVNNLQFIPPYEKGFVSKSHCHEDCIKMAVGNQTNSLKVFGVLLHAHLLGAKLTARHFRGDRELEPFSKDDNYDFDYQDFRAMKQEREIKYGDSLAMDCTYDSSSRTKPTVGGLPTTSEMCLAFLFYYPKVNVTFCLSQPNYDQLSSVPWHAVKQLNTWDWKDKSVRDNFNEIVDNSTYNYICYGLDKSANIHFKQGNFHLPEPTKYAPPPRQCPSGH